MKCVIPKIPDYHRLCEMAERVPSLDPQAVLTTATVHSVGLELAAGLEMSLADHGISEGRLRVLCILLCLDRPATHSELAEKSGVTKGTITGLIDGLERDGFVKRTRSAEDRRVTWIETTKSGQTSLDAILPKHLARLSKLMSNLSVKEQKQLVALLLKVRKGLPALTK